MSPLRTSPISTHSMARAGRLLALTLTVLFSAGCGDDPLGVTKWIARTDTVTIYSLARPELNLLSAFNFHERTPIRIESVEAAARWDIALDTRGGKLVILPPGALGVTSQGRILQLPGETFATVVEAPKDTVLYTATQALPVVLNALYIVKTDLRPTEFGGNCAFYAKMSPIAFDVAAGSMTFIHDSSPICSDRRLIPPDTT